MILFLHGELDGAMVLYKEQERLCRELRNRDFLAQCLRNQAVILFDFYRNKKAASAKCEEALRIFESLHIAPEIMLTKGVLLRMQSGITLRLVKTILVALAVLGVTLGYWNAWLWVIGGPIAMWSLGTLLLGFKFLSRSRLRLEGFYRQLLADIQHNEIDSRKNV